jgi:hypothetical protein
MFDLSPTQRICLRAPLDALAHGERLAADCAIALESSLPAPLRRVAA